MRHIGLWRGWRRPSPAGMACLIISLLLAQPGAAVPGRAAVPQGPSLARATASFPNGTLVRGDKDPHVYAIYYGSAHWIANATVLDLLGFNFEQVVTLPQAIVNAIPRGGTFVERVAVNSLPDPYSPIRTIVANISTINPSAPAGGAITIKGTGFKPAEIVQLVLANGALVSQAQANGAGAIQAVIVVPGSLAAGIYRLTAYGLTGHNLAIEPVTVIPPTAHPTVVPVPGTVPPGGAFAVSGAGFLPGETLYLYDAGAYARTGVADGAGAYGPVPLLVPRSVAPGVHSVRVFGARSRYLAVSTIIVAAAPPPPPVMHVPPLADGTLVRGDKDPRVYAIYKGVAHWIVNPTVLDLLGFSLSQVGTLPQAIMNAAPKGGNFVERFLVNGLPNPYSPILTAAANIVVSPPAAPAGATITVTGNGFKPTESVQLSLANGTLVVQVPANGAGAIETTVTVPGSLPPAVYRLTGFGLSSGRLAIEPVTVMPPGAHPTVAPSVATVPPGGTFTASGAGFLPGETLYVYDAGAYGTVSAANGAGAYGPVTLQVPRTVTLGAHSVVVYGTRSRYVARGVITVANPPPPPPVIHVPPLTDGTLLRGSVNPRVYVVYRGVAHWIVNPTVLDLLGFTGAPVGALPQPVVDAIPKGSDLNERILVNGLPNPFSPIDTAGPVLSTATPSAAAGGTITVKGAGFAPGEPVQLNLATGALVAQVTADGAGAFQTTIAVPASLAVGIYRLSGIGASGRFAVEPLTVIPPGAHPTIAPAPSFTTAGGTFTVSGDGFLPGEPLYLYAAFGFGAGSAANGTGAYGPVTLQMPASLPVGTNSIAVFGARSRYFAVGTIIVAPPGPGTVQVAPPNTSIGALETVSGGGFVPGETVTFAVDNQPAGQVTADGSGNFAGVAITVPPNVRAGQVALAVRGTLSGRVAAATVNVVALSPRLLVSPGSGAPGRVLNLAGTGFAPGEPVTLSFNGVALATTPQALTADAQGNFFATGAIPPTAVSGPNALTATGTRSRAVAVASVNVVLPTASTWYFAGLNTSSGAHSLIAVLNPQHSPARLTLHIAFPDGPAREHTLFVGAHSRATVDMRELVGGRRPLIALRLSADRRVTASETLSRGDRDWSSITGISAPSRVWYLAEGYTGASFRDYLRIYNPHTGPVKIDVRLIPGRGKERTVRIDVSGDSVRELAVNQYISGQPVSAIVSAATPIVVNRLTIYGRGGFGATEETGSAAAAATWYYADSGAASGFQTSYTVLNPNRRDPAAVTATFYNGRGAAIGTRTIIVGPLRQATLRANDAVRANGMTAVLTSNIPVVAERTMYFGSSKGRAGSSLIGRNGGGRTWAFPGGDTSRGKQEFLIVWNLAPRTALVEATFYTTAGSMARAAIMVPPHGRAFLHANAVRGLPAGQHGAILTSRNNLPIVAEQSIYARGLHGGDATAGIAQ